MGLNRCTQLDVPIGISTGTARSVQYLISTVDPEEIWDFLHTEMPIRSAERIRSLEHASRPYEKCCAWTPGPPYISPKHPNGSPKRQLKTSLFGVSILIPLLHLHACVCVCFSRLSQDIRHHTTLIGSPCGIDKRKVQGL